MTRSVGTFREAVDLALSGQSSVTHCPTDAHPNGDRNPSLSVGPGSDQPVVVKCHSQGCTLDDILRTSGDVEAAEVLRAPERPHTPPPRGSRDPFALGAPVATYEYEDEVGKVLFQVRRFQPPGQHKTFRQGTVVDGRFKAGMDGVRRVPYRLPEVLKARENGETIVVVEGEKDVETLRGLGKTATCNPMGAGKWLPEYSALMAGSDVVVIRDNDDPGIKHSRQVRESLMMNDCRVRVFECASGHKDITDHIKAGLTISDLVEVVPDEPEHKVRGPKHINEYLAARPGPREWVIPGLLCPPEVLLLTGYEGLGKSTFVKQFAMQASSGMHPFTGLPIPAVDTLLIDLENPNQDNYEDFERLAGLATGNGLDLSKSRLWIEDDVPSQDLTSEMGRMWLEERVHAYKPRLLCIGPLYNMMREDAASEASVRPLLETLNHIRNDYGCALIIEHHVPHGDSAARDLRPIGSSILRRWPAFGYGLAPITEKARPGQHKPRQTGVFEWTGWRGARRRDRKWPEHLRWGTRTEGSLEWPWMEAEPDVVDEALRKARGD